MSEKNADLWMRMYEEQVRHARHHETLRAQSTNTVIAISAALLALLASNVVSADRRFILGAFLVVVNVYGLIMSLKHYERSRLHVGVAGKYRDIISQASALAGNTLNDMRSAGQSAHADRFPWIARVRAYALWSGLHLVLAVVGVFVSIIR